MWFFWVFLFCLFVCFLPNVSTKCVRFSVVFVVVVVLWLLLLFCVGVGLCAFVCVCGCGCGGVWGCVCDMFKCSVTISTQPLRNAMRYTGFQVSDVGWNARSLCTSVDWKRG